LGSTKQLPSRPKVRYNKEPAPWFLHHHSLGRWQAAASMPSNRALRAMQRAAQQPARRKKYIKPMFASNKWKVLRGDEVMVMAGKDRGTTGTVLQVLRDKARPRVVVEGRNLVRPSQRWRLVPRCPAARLPASARNRADFALSESLPGTDTAAAAAVPEDGDD